MRRFLRLVTLDQWEALERDYPVNAQPSPSERNKILGLYLLAALVLFSNQFLWKDAWNLFVPEDIREGPDRKFFRRVYWTWFLSFVYVVPTWLYAKYILRFRLSDLGLSTRGFVKHLWLYGIQFGYQLYRCIQVAACPNKKNLITPVVRNNLSIAQDRQPNSRYPCPSLNCTQTTGQIIAACR